MVLQDHYERDCRKKAREQKNGTNDDKKNDPTIATCDDDIVIVCDDACVIQYANKWIGLLTCKPPIDRC